MPTFDFTTLLWWGLPLAAAPLVIHLINLLRQRRVRWAAMEFLLASQRKYRTRVLLRQLLLLAVRTAAILGLVLALAQPRWRQTLGGLVGGASTTHVVVLDDSGSMGDLSTAAAVGEVLTDATDGQTRPATAFDRGRRVVEQIAADLVAEAGGQELAVGLTSVMATATVATAAGPAAAAPRSTMTLLSRQPVTPQAVQQLRDALAGCRVSASAAGPREALAAAAAECAAAGGGPRVLWIVSDFRVRDWSEPAATADLLRQLSAAGVSVRFVDCAAEPGPGANLSIERLEVIGGVPAAGVLLPVEVEVRNDSSTIVRNVLVELREDGGGRPGVRIDEIPAGGTAVRRFDARFASVGGHAVEAELAADVLPFDDVRRAVVDVVDQVDVLVIDGDPRGSGTTGDGFYVATALAPGSGAPTGLRPRIESPRALAAADLAMFDSIWLLDVERLERAEIEAVEAYAARGGGVVFCCGPRTQAETVNRMLYRGGAGLFPVPLAGAVDLLPSTAAATPVPDVVVEDHPVVAVLAGQRNPLVDAVRIDRFWAVERGHDPVLEGVRRLLSLRTGQPLAVEKPFGDGLVVALLTTAAPTWNNWARGNPSWVVVVLELESHLARTRRRAETLDVGDPVTVRLEPGVDEIDVDFLVPPKGGLVRQSATVVGEALEARLPVADVPGIYEARWRRLDGGERQRLVAVNVDPTEGRLERIGRERLGRTLEGVTFRYDQADALEAASGSLGGASLTMPLLLTVVAVLLVEQLLAYAAGYHPLSRRPSHA